MKRHVIVQALTTEFAEAELNVLTEQGYELISTCSGTGNAHIIMFFRRQPAQHMPYQTGACH